MNINSLDRFHYIILFSILVLSCLLIWFFSQDSNSETSSINLTEEVHQRNSINTSSLLSLEKRLTKLAESVSQIDKRFNMNNYGVANNLEKSISKLEELEFTDPDEQAEIEFTSSEQSYQEQISLLEEQLQNPEDNSEWAKNSENVVAESFEKSDIYDLDSVSCNNSICKLEANIVLGDELSDRTTLAQSPGIDHFLHGDLGWTGPTLFEVDTETGKATVYLIKEKGGLLLLEDG